MGTTRVSKKFDNASQKNIEYRYDRLLALANAWIFQDYIKPTDSVLHFLCGGGFLLNSLVSGDKYGIEFNAEYAAAAQSNFGIRVSPSFAGLKNLDVVFFMHTLSQQPNPLQALLDAHGALKDGGTAVVVVPCYNHKMKYVEPNFEQHFFSWSPMDIGNLVHRAGFKVLSSERICHRIPPKGEPMSRFFSEGIFHLICRTYGWLFPTQTQIRVVAVKTPATPGAVTSIS
jgi:SAM-dependent methyltransferase